MWNRILGKSNDDEDNLPSQSSRRKEKSTLKRSESTTSAQEPSRGDDRDRVSQPYPPLKNASNADSVVSMPRSQAERDERDSLDRDRRSERRRERAPKERRHTEEEYNGKRDKRRNSDKRQMDAVDAQNSKGVAVDYGASAETTRGDFNTQIGEPSFVQFPGQTGAGFIGGPPPASASASMSAHVQDQFPNQFPTSSAEPYRPPLAISEGGPGLAADYYGDAGESVAMQPGVRPQPPNLIIGAEPHLQPASSTVAPPPEPSATGHVGAAASFFSEDFLSEENQSSHLQNTENHNAPSPSALPMRPQTTDHPSSHSTIPLVGAAAAGAAGAYYMASHSASNEHGSSVGGGRPSTSQQPTSYTNGSYSSNLHDSRPSRPGKQTSYPSNVPLYAAGAAGSAAPAYHQDQFSHSQHHPSSQSFPGGSMAQRHRHQGPLAKFVDFFKDPEGVAQFEEYTEYIGVCRDCFDPRSSPRDAPRKHRYRSRRSGDRFGSSARIDKDSRYSSSDSEKRRKKKESWLEAGVAGYGLSKVGESLFNQNHGFDDIYSVKSGHLKESRATMSPDRSSFTSRGRTEKTSKVRSRHRSSSRKRVEMGLTSDSQVYKRDSHGEAIHSPITERYDVRRRSGSRSRLRSRDRKNGLGEVAIGAAVGSSVVASKTRRSGHSPERTLERHGHEYRERSSEGRNGSLKKEKRKKRGFFSFSSPSSSSSSEDLRYDVRSAKRKSRRRRNSRDDHRKAEIAVAGLGAAAAALAVNETRRNNRLKERSDLVAVKESREKARRGSERQRRKHASPLRLEEDPWESASNDEESVVSELAYGDSIRRSNSHSSLSSKSSGTDKWGWRWGSKQKTKRIAQRHRDGSPDHNAGINMQSNDCILLQQMYPVPTSGPLRSEPGSHALNDPSPRRTAARPEPVPLQHPQPVAPVSSAVYSAHAPYQHVYSAPTGSPLFIQPTSLASQVPEAPQQSAYAAVSSFQIPGSFPETISPGKSTDGASRLSKSRRRDSSPATYSMATSGPAEPKHSSSVGQVPSAVRFNLTEEQAKKDRRDRRRQERDEVERQIRSERNEMEKQKDSQPSNGLSEEKSERGSLSGPHAETLEHADELGDNRSGTILPDKRSSWTSPVAAAGIASIVGAAVKGEKSASTISDRDDLERRERRRRRREEREAPDRGSYETSCNTRQEIEANEKEPGTSMWRDVANANRSATHEDYKDFFTPKELLSKAPEYKQAVADPDTDHTITAYETPEVVTIEPKAFHDSREAPAYTFGPDGEELNPHPKSPSWVPKLKLISPTPQPSSLAGSERWDISPIIEPQNAVPERSADAPPPIHAYEVELDDQHTPEYTVIEPKGHRDEVVQPLWNENSKGEHLVGTAEEKDLPDPPIVQKVEAKSTAGFGDDIDFAATLAAGLEDAGMDPSIVIDDPSFRRRDSPPGSEEPGTYRQPFAQSMQNLASDIPPQQGFVEGEVQESSMPGSYVEEEAPFDQLGEPDRKLGKKEKKKRDKKGKRDELAKDLEQEPLERTTEAPDSRVTELEPLDADKEAQVIDISTSVGETPSIAASTLDYADTPRGKKSKKKAKRDGQKFDGEASVSSAPGAPEEVPKTSMKSAERRKSGINESPERSNQEIADPITTEEAPDVEDFEQIQDRKRRGKKPKGRKSAREVGDFTPIEASQDLNGGVMAKEEWLRDSEQRQRSSNGVSPKDSGRITQGLPAKVSPPASTGPAPSSPTDKWLTNPEDRNDSFKIDEPSHGIDDGPPFVLTGCDLIEGTQMPSFLGMRQEVPPSPNIPFTVEPPLPTASERRLSSPLSSDLIVAHGLPSGTTSLPTSPNRRSEFQAQRLSELQKAENSKTPLPSSSPTAIPFHFRLPPTSPGVARSSPSVQQTPYTPDTIPSRPKLRPRSTEFKSSNEFRPLWLVERHASKQEQTPEEAYPSLPSSHTTSRASSVRDPTETASDRSEFFESLEYNDEDDLAEAGLLIDTSRANTAAGLLDSQQTTPTAATFPTASKQTEEPRQLIVDPQHESSSLQHTSGLEHTSETTKRSVRATSPQIDIGQESSLPNLKSITLGAVLGASAAGSLLAAKHGETPVETQNDKAEANRHAEMEEKQEPTVIQASLQDPDDFMGASEDPLHEDREGQDLTNDQFSGTDDHFPARGSETLRSSSSKEVDSLTTEQHQAIQEKDAQDAVDSWFAPVSPRKSASGKSGRKKKRNMDPQVATKEALPSERSLAVQPIEDRDLAAAELALQGAIDARQHEKEMSVPSYEANAGLQRDMPAKEVAYIMGNTAEATEDISDASTMAQIERPISAEQEESVTVKKPKDRSAEKLKKTSEGVAQHTTIDLVAEEKFNETADPKSDMPLPRDPVERTLSLIEDLPLVRTDLDPINQEVRDSAASSVPSQQMANIDDYGLPTQKSKRGKRKSKQEDGPQGELELKPQTRSVSSNDLEKEIASQSLQQIAELEQEADVTSYAADVLYAQNLPLPAEDDSEFLSSATQSQVERAASNQDDTIARELPQFEGRKGDLLTSPDTGDFLDITERKSKDATDEPESASSATPVPAVFKSMQSGVSDENNANELFPVPTKKGKKGKKNKAKPATVLQHEENPESAERELPAEPEERNVDDMPGLTKGKGRKAKKRSLVLGAPDSVSDEATGPQSVDAEKSDTSALQPEEELVKPDEIELPASETDDEVSEAPLTDPIFIKEEPPQDDMETQVTLSQGVANEVSEPCIPCVEDKEQTKIAVQRSQEDPVVKIQEQQHEALISTAAPFDVAIKPVDQAITDLDEATKKARSPDELSPAMGGTGLVEAPEPQLQENVPSDATASTSASVPQERESRPALPFVPVASTDTAETIKGISSSSDMSQHNDLVGLDTMIQEVDTGGSTRQAISEQESAGDEASRDQETNREGKMTRLRDDENIHDTQIGAAGEEMTSLENPSTASTDTALTVQRLLGSDKSMDTFGSPQQEINTSPALGPEELVPERELADDQIKGNIPERRKEKKGKKGRNTFADDFNSSEILGPPSNPVTEGSELTESPSIEPVAEFTSKKSKKDKKSKRKQSIPVDNNPPDTVSSEANPDYEVGRDPLGPTIETEFPIAQDNVVSAIAHGGTESPQQTGIIEPPRRTLVDLMAEKGDENGSDEQLGRTSTPDDYPESRHQEIAMTNPGDDVEVPHAKEKEQDPLAISREAAQASMHELVASEGARSNVNQASLPEKEVVEAQPRVSDKTSYGKLAEEQLTVDQDVEREERRLQNTEDMLPLRYPAAAADETAREASELVNLTYDAPAESAKAALGSSLQGESVKNSPIVSAEENVMSPVIEAEGASAREKVAEDDLALAQDMPQEPAQNTTDDLTSVPRSKKDKKKTKGEIASASDATAEGTLSKMGQDTDTMHDVLEKSATSNAADSEVHRQEERHEEKSMESRSSIFEDGISNVMQEGGIGNESATPRPRPKPDSTVTQRATQIELGKLPELEPTNILGDTSIEPKKIAEDEVDSVTGILETVVDDDKDTRERSSTSALDDPKAIHDSQPANLKGADGPSQSALLDKELGEPPSNPREGLDEEIAAAPKSKKDRKKAKKSKSLSWASEPDVLASGRDDDVIETKAEESFDPMSAELEPQLESRQPSFGTASGAEEKFESVPKSRKEKKKAKKSKALSWADEPELVTPERDNDEVHPRVSEGSMAMPTDSVVPSTTPADVIEDQHESASKSKKDRKKTRTPKVSSGIGEELDVTIEEQDTSSQPGLNEGLRAISSETAGLNPSTNVPDQSTTKDSTEEFDNTSKSKKERKKAKKSRNMPSEDDAGIRTPAMSSTTREITEGPSDGPAMPISLDELSKEPMIESNAEVADDFESVFQSKKAKKKSKKTKTPEWSSDPGNVSLLAENSGQPQPNLESTQSSGTSILQLERVPEQPILPKSLHQSNAESDKSTDIAQSRQQNDLDLEQSAAEPEPFVRPAGATEGSFHEAQIFDQSVFDAEKLLPSEEASKIPSPKSETNLLPLAAPEQTFPETEQTAKLEKTQAPENIVPVERRTDEEHGASDSQGIADTTAPFQTPELELERTDARLSARSVAPQDVSEMLRTTPQAAEELLPSNIPTDSSLHNNQTCEGLPRQTQPYDVLPSFDDEEEREQVSNVQEPTKESESRIPQEPSEGQHHAEAFLPLEPIVEEFLPSDGLDTYQKPDTEPTKNELDLEPLSSLEKSKKDRNKAKQARVLDVEDEVAQSAPKVISEGFADQPPTEVVPQDNEGSQKGESPDSDKAFTVEAGLATKSGSDREPEATYQRAFDSMSERGPESTTDKNTLSASPEQAHKRGFFEDAGPDVAFKEEIAMEPPSKAKRTDENDPPSQKIVEMEEEVFSLPAKKSKKGKKSKKSTSTIVETESRDLPAAIAEVDVDQPSSTIDRSIVTPERRQSEPSVTEQLSENTIEGMAAAVPDDSAFYEQGSQILRQETVDDDTWDMPAKKSQKGKKSKNSTQQSAKTGPASLAIADPETIIDQPFCATDEKKIPQEQRRDEIVPREPPYKDASEEAPVATSESLAGFEQDAKDSIDQPAEDDFWGGPVKKGKKDKKGRKRAVRLQSEPEMVAIRSPHAAMPADGPTQDVPMDRETTSSDVPLNAEQIVDDPMVESLKPFNLEGQQLSEVNAAGNNRILGDVGNDLNESVAQGDARLPEDEPIVLQEDKLIEGDRDNAAFGTTKKGKKGKKGKSRQQTIDWEDRATAPVTGTTDLYASESTVQVPRDDFPPFEGHLPKPQSISDSLDNLRHNGDDLQIVSPKNEYTALEIEPARDPNRSDDYFGIPISKSSETYVAKQLSPKEVEREPMQYSQEYPVVYEDRDFSPNVGETKEPVAKIQEQEINVGDNKYGLGYATNDPSIVQKIEGPDQKHRLQEVANEDAFATEEQLEDAQFATTKKAKKDKKSKKRDLPAQVAHSVEENVQEKPTNHMNTRLRSTSPARSPTIEDGQTSPGRGLGISEALAAVGSIGASAAIAESLSRKESKKLGKKDKKGKKSSITEKEEKEQPDFPIRYEPVQGIDDGQQQSQVNPEVASPRTPVWEQRHVDTADLQEQSSNMEKKYNRDSAVHVTDSPLIVEPVSVHRAARDSGYPETEASPVIDSGHDSRAASTEHEASLADPFVETSNPSERSQTHGLLPGERSTDALDIDIEAGHNNEGNWASKPEGQRRSQQRLTPEADHAYELDTERVVYDDPPEPSPVNSTTKNRSSALFYSSPSTREGPPHPLPHVQSSPPTRHTPENQRAMSPGFPKSLSRNEREAPHQSIFGGLASGETGVPSPPMSPIAMEGSRRAGLDVINENELEESSSHKKDRQSFSDMGSPNPGVKSQRRRESFQRPLRSPPLVGHSTEDMVSTDDIISRLSWPTVDDEKHSVDLERSRSRATDRQASGRQSVISTSGIPPKPVDGDVRSFSGASIRSGESINAIIRTPPGSIKSPGTPPLRRVDRSVSGDLREANRKGHSHSNAKKRAMSVEPEPAIAESSSLSHYDPTKDKGKGKVREMADVYVSIPLFHSNTNISNDLQEGWGDVHGGAGSPKPQSMRKRQSMQILDLEGRLDQLVSENRLLKDAKTRADRSLDDAAQDSKKQNNALREAIETRDLYLRQKDDELRELRQILEGLQSQVSQLTEVNQSLTATRGLADEHEQRYSQLQAEHTNTYQQWQNTERELDELRQQHSNLSGGMEEIVRNEISVAVDGKNAELRQVRDELEAAKNQVRALQQQILESRSKEDFIVDRDEDYFDGQCQKLCQHVQQWVLRFSKFSDMKACHLASEIMEEKFVDRMENAILDGTDVDTYLSDRVKRRDVFMSVVMTMVWDYIFTRYLFGMDREQRQKLKSLEKTLSEIGPMAAVHQWRATTLTLLSKRQAYLAQRAQDTEAVVHEIYSTLSTFLHPPSHLQQQIMDSLRKVISAAVDLSIDMRTQRAEYIMLPPLQPEYDTNGDLARKVYFNASLMNERSGTTTSNEALEAQQAVVRMVLFPLVVKKGDETGVGDEEIVVCPAQVLTAPVGKEKKTVRVMSAEPSARTASYAGSDVGRME